jgi:hypothetical protein
MRFREHRHNLQQGLLKKSKLAQQTYEEGRRLGWDDAKILEIESSSMYRKYKESDHLACITNRVWIFLQSGSVSSVRGL